MAQPLPARPGSRGIDTAWKITPEIAKALAAWRDPKTGAKVEYVLRYFSLPDPRHKSPAPGDLDAAEVAGLLDAGLAVGGILHVRFAPWLPGPERGAADGLAIVTQARACGFLPGCMAAYDMEGPTGTVSSIAAYDAALVAVVKAAGFIPGGYFGYQVPLTGEEMWDLGVERYLRAGGAAPAEPDKCGWCWLQELPFDQPLCGIKVDWSRVQQDKLGRVPVWLGP